MSTFVFQVQTNREEYTKTYMERALEATAPELDGRFWIPRGCLYGIHNDLINPVLFPGYLFLDTTDEGIDEYRLALRKTKINRQHMLLLDTQIRDMADPKKNKREWGEGGRVYSDWRDELEAMGLDRYTFDFALKVTEQELEWIKVLSGEKPAEIYKEGRSVRFIEGAFVGLNGFIKKYDARRHNVKVEVEMFGTRMNIWVACNEVVPDELGALVDNDRGGSIGNSWNLDRFRELYDHKVLRKQITYGKFAASVGVSARTAKKWRSGEIIPTGKYVKDIADYFGVDTSELMG